MTPPTHPCEGCFLQESREGRVCPPARDVYGLADLIAQRQAEALRAALAQDAENTRSLAQCICIDASLPAPHKLLPATSPTLLLAAAPTGRLSADFRKEPVHVPAARTVA